MKMSHRNLIDDCFKIYQNHIYPALFTEIDRPPIWPVLAAATVIYLVASETNHQSCQNGDCDLYKKLNKKDEDITDKIENIIDHIDLQHNVVEWRRVLVVSIILSLIILWLFNPALPDGFDFFLVTFLLFMIVYPISNMYNYNFYKSDDQIHQDKLYHLRNQIKTMEINNTLVSPVKFSSSNFITDIDKILEGI